MKKMYIAISILVCIALAVALFVNQKKFGRLPQGERLARIEQSSNYRDGEFRNQCEAHMVPFEAFKSMFHRGNIRPQEPMQVIKTDLKQIAQSENYIIWFGHSSYFIQSEGVRILVDPVFCTASPVSFVNKPFDGTPIYSPDDMPDIDYLFISHDHWDHLDYETVMALKNRIAHVVCPLGVGEHFEYWGFDKSKIIEMDWYENIGTSDLNIHCRPTVHFSGRDLRRNKTLWGSFIVETSAHTFFIGGDSGYGPHFAEVGRDFTNIDYAFIENGQYNKAWSGIHTMPQYLDSIVNDVHARHIITVHNSKYALALHDWDEPIKNAKRLQQKHANVLVPTIGEIITIE